MLFKLPILTLFFGLSASLVVLGAPTNSTLLPSRSAHIENPIPAWPMFVEAEGGDGEEVKVETNAERMKRGLGPLAPAKPYDSKRHVLQPRISHAPANAIIGYTFRGCSDNAAGGLPNLLVGAGGPTTIETALVFCSAYSNPSRTFAVSPVSPIINGFAIYNCQRNIQTFTTSGCTATNPAIYQRY